MQGLRAEWDGDEESGGICLLAASLGDPSSPRGGRPFAVYVTVSALKGLSRRASSRDEARTWQTQTSSGACLRAGKHMRRPCRAGPPLESGQTLRASGVLAGLKHPRRIGSEARNALRHGPVNASPDGSFFANHERHECVLSGASREAAVKPGGSHATPPTCCVPPRRKYPHMIGFRAGYLGFNRAQLRVVSWSQRGRNLHPTDV